MNDTQTGWEQRWHPLLREWVVYSAHRQTRPWTGEQLQPAIDSPDSYDPACYLCPGNSRVGGKVNPAYSGVYVFDNDRPSIGPDAPVELDTAPGIYRNAPATGLARVICYSPNHNLTMSELGTVEVETVINEWQRQTTDLAAISGIRSISIFENKGEICGMSNPHPHGQIYATNFTSKTIESYLLASKEYRQTENSNLFADILSTELADSRRVVAENESMVAFIPYFARFAYELYIMPRRGVAYITDLSDAESADLASLLHEVTIRMDNLWSRPFPYHLMLHQAPVDDCKYDDFRFHIAFYPPMRTPQLRKFIASYELGSGNYLSDTIPEKKAAELRQASTELYKHGV